MKPAHLIGCQVDIRQRESEQVLVVRVITFVLDPIVNQFVRHELQALTCFHKDEEHANLNEEIADEVKQG